MARKAPITPNGYARLQAELRRLKTEARPRAVAALKAAREHGDISENAEFEAAKEHQAHVEGRILALEGRLASVEVIDTRGQEPDRVRFGATVVLEDLGSGDEVTYTIVGEDEGDVAQGMLSVTSPVGRALIGRSIDDAITVRVPSGVREYEIRDIRFE